MFCGEELVDGDLYPNVTGYTDELFDACRFMMINAIDGSRISGRSSNGWGEDYY
jgi:hypothetical protein